MDKKNDNLIERPPVVVIMGHIDHGKSTLLDYIRKTNIAEKEAGGITQHISAYEVTHTDEEGAERKITFLDTPGHESFSKMRERGAQVADIAVLLVSAEDGVKSQTIEAKNTILASGTPYLVAINKIDKPEANVEKTKQELLENEIYLENYGGKIPCALISAKSGEGVDNLLSLINLMAMMENFRGDPEKNASGFVIEANMDPRRGIEATLIIKDGTLKKGMCAASGESICSTNIMENFLGQPINEASFSSPIRLVGWSKMPSAGAEFKSFENKKNAEEYAAGESDICRRKPAENKKEEAKKNQTDSFVQKVEEEKGSEIPPAKKIIPVVLKADAQGSIEALEKEIQKIQNNEAEFRIVQKGVGSISEFDIKAISFPKDTLILGFNVKADRSALDIATQKNIEIHTFDVIYKLTEWLTLELAKRMPKKEENLRSGQAKILKIFSRTKEKEIVGGKVLEGTIKANSRIRVIRRDFEIGQVRILNLEKNRMKVGEATEGEEFGAMIEGKTELAKGDVLESFNGS